MHPFRIILSSLTPPLPSWVALLGARFPSIPIHAVSDAPLALLSSTTTEDSKAKIPAGLILGDNLPLDFYARFQDRGDVLHVLETPPFVTFARWKQILATDEEEIVKHVTGQYCSDEPFDKPGTVEASADNAKTEGAAMESRSLLADAHFPVPYQLGVLIHAAQTDAIPKEDVSFWSTLSTLLDALVRHAIANDARIFPAIVDETERMDLYDRLFVELAKHGSVSNAAMMDAGSGKRMAALLRDAVERFDNGTLSRRNETGKYLKVTWRDCRLDKASSRLMRQESQADAVKAFVECLLTKQ